MDIFWDGQWSSNHHADILFGTKKLRGRMEGVPGKFKIHREDGRQQAGNSRRVSMQIRGRICSFLRSLLFCSWDLQLIGSST